MRTWTYPPELLGSLGGFGLAPTERTAPGFVRDALNDLYRYELRRLRDAYLAKRVAKTEYLARVIDTRKRYWPLTLQLPDWERICAGP